MDNRFWIRSALVLNEMECAGWEITEDQIEPYIRLLYPEIQKEALMLGD